MENIRTENHEAKQKINLMKWPLRAFFLVCGSSLLSSCGFPADNEKNIADDLIEKSPAIDAVDGVHYQPSRAGILKVAMPPA